MMILAIKHRAFRKRMVNGILGFYKKYFAKNNVASITPRALDDDLGY